MNNHTVEFLLVTLWLNIYDLSNSTLIWSQEFLSLFDYFNGYRKTMLFINICIIFEYIKSFIFIGILRDLYSNQNSYEKTILQLFIKINNHLLKTKYFANLILLSFQTNIDLFRSKLYRFNVELKFFEKKKKNFHKFKKKLILCHDKNSDLLLNLEYLFDFYKFYFFSKMFTNQFFFNNLSKKSNKVNSTLINMFYSTCTALNSKIFEISNYNIAIIFNQLNDSQHYNYFSKILSIKSSFNKFINDKIFINLYFQFIKKNIKYTLCRFMFKIKNFKQIRFKIIKLSLITQKLKDLKLKFFTIESRFIFFHTLLWISKILTNLPISLFSNNFLFFQQTETIQKNIRLLIFLNHSLLKEQIYLLILRIMKINIIKFLIIKNEFLNSIKLFLSFIVKQGSFKSVLPFKLLSTIFFIVFLVLFYNNNENEKSKNSEIKIYRSTFPKIHNEENSNIPVNLSTLKIRILKFFGFSISRILFHYKNKYIFSIEYFDNKKFFYSYFNQNLFHINYVQDFIVYEKIRKNNLIFYQDKFEVKKFSYLLTYNFLRYIKICEMSKICIDFKVFKINWEIINSEILFQFAGEFCSKKLNFYIIMKFNNFLFTSLFNKNFFLSEKELRNFFRKIDIIIFSKLNFFSSLLIKKFFNLHKEKNNLYMLNKNLKIYKLTTFLNEKFKTKNLMVKYSLDDDHIYSCDSMLNRILKGTISIQADFLLINLRKDLRYYFYPEVRGILNQIRILNEKLLLKMKVNYKFLYFSKII
ncbi:hypothetical protein (nucleomorph) [Guillardia theta]|uniref:Uncharacterized protein n=2 Tax=Guillardia theta TaxID=55529 RepID=Q98S90_GUITH|nr:hypothetical protein GTHECHR3049 [Guillardia theta]AAK39693.1 hypothetical protein [Guillardia theta]